MHLIKEIIVLLKHAQFINNLKKMKRFNDSKMQVWIQRQKKKNKMKLILKHCNKNKCKLNLQGLYIIIIINFLLNIF